MIARGLEKLNELGERTMRSSALLFAALFVIASPSLALAKTAKHATHHVRHHAVAKQAGPSDDNTAFARALSDLFMALGKPPKAGTPASE